MPTSLFLLKTLYDFIRKISSSWTALYHKGSNGIMTLDAMLVQLRSPALAIFLMPPKVLEYLLLTSGCMGRRRFTQRIQRFIDIIIMLRNSISSHPLEAKAARLILPAEFREKNRRSAVYTFPTMLHTWLKFNYIVRYFCLEFFSPWEAKRYEHIELWFKNVELEI